MSGPATGGTTLLIKGSGFTWAVSVSIGIPITSFTVLDDATISVVTPNVLNPVTNQPNFGTVDVTVTTPGGTSAVTPADQFTYVSTPTPPPTPTSTPGPVPVIASISPMSGPASGGTTILIKGSGFTGATSVTFVISAAFLVTVTSFTVLDDSTISVVTPGGISAATGLAVGKVDVRVTTPWGTSALTPADQFTYL
jgi:hypothetical protein